MGLGILLLTLLLGVSGQDDETDKNSQFIITLPSDLAAKYPNGVNERPALFGDPSFGREFAISGLLVHAASGDLNGCQGFRREDVPLWPETGPAIVLVDRGNCTFVTKVRHAQEAGAVACIVVDNVDEPGIPMMADDGTGGDIRIPAMLIHKNDGLVIQQYMRFKVFVSLSWNIPHPDNRVEWDVWTSSDDFALRDFKRQFGKVSEALNKNAFLTPHYSFEDGEAHGCVSDQESDACKQMCTNGGRYCVIHPGQEDFLGYQVVQENLRQICFVKTHLQENQTLTSGAKLWFDYSTRFLDECAASNTWTKECAERIMTSLSIDVIKINSCIIASGGYEINGGVNELIAAEMSQRWAAGIFFIPTITINDMTYRGSLPCLSFRRTTCGLLSALCAGFADDSVPQACNVSSPCELGVPLDSCGSCGEQIQDKCGTCFAAVANPERLPHWNQKCAGCDGQPNSKAVKDGCGVCNGPGVDKCGTCLPIGDVNRIERNSSRSCNDRPGFETDGIAPASTGFPVWAIVFIVVVILVGVGIGVTIVVRQREAKMRSDVDDLLKQYMPMEVKGGGDGGVGKATANARVAINEGNVDSEA